jgi:hypothetical protein
MGKKMGFTEKQVGHMTFYKFDKLYQAYKNIFDLENKLKYNRTTYAELEKEETLDDAIPF